MMAKLQQWQFTSQFAGRLAAMSVPPDLAKEIAAIVQADGAEFPRCPPGTMALMVPVAYWIIRDDDLELAKSFTAGVAAATASHLWDGSISASALAGIIGGVLNTARAARRKGVRVSVLSYKLLLALKIREQGLSVEEATETLNIMLDDEDAELQSADIDTMLRELCAMRVGDGTVIAFVAEDSEGRWRGCGV